MDLERSCIIVTFVVGCVVYEIYFDFQMFAFYHFIFSHFTKINPGSHMTSKAVSRPVRFTKQLRRTTNHSRDMLDFRFLAFCQR